VGMTPKEEFESQPLSFIRFNEQLCAVLAEIDVFTVGDLMNNLKPVIAQIKLQTDRELVKHFVMETTRLYHIFSGNMNRLN
jgi:hypothetical protein